MSSPYLLIPYLYSGEAPSWARILRRRAKARSRQSRMFFNLTVEDMGLLVKRARGQCEVTGIPFSDQPTPNSGRRPFIPSLDRIEPARGYTLANCRLVVFAANMAMSDWGWTVLFRLARGLMRKHERGKTGEDNEE